LETGELCEIPVKKQKDDEKVSAIWRSRFGQSLALPENEA